MPDKAYVSAKYGRNGMVFNMCQFNENCVKAGACFQACDIFKTISSTDSALCLESVGP